MIEVNGLSKRYGDVVAVNDLSFTVPAGLVTGFLGPNGAGKSTTMRMILGLNRPTSGSALVDGRPFTGWRAGLRRVGALLDAGDVHPGRSARAHLSALARTNGLPHRRVHEVLEEVGLADVARRRVGGFSLGMRQRLGIAAALLGDPPVLLFDEPVNGLDPEGVRWVRGLFRRLAAEGRTVLVSSHLMSEMEHTADRLVVVGRGELLAEETVAEFSARGGRARVTVRTPQATRLVPLMTAAGATVTADDPAPDGPAAPPHATQALTVTGLPAPQVGELAFHHHIVLHELAAHHASLEEAFMDLTADHADYRADAQFGHQPPKRPKHPPAAARAEVDASGGQAELGTFERIRRQEAHAQAKAWAEAAR
ncbi:ABC transporter ATP-binding protein [Actinomadura oligospora]|uniref:ABC transporter ATP-binding protein n=1 Tax=Actinomadura oligospora TaxID=111804 RepID=UPI001B802871|nr:ABC transporter ATP-binding protein [Actinomadura oligospora]